VAHALILVSVLTEWEWLETYTRDVDGFIGVAAAVGAVSSWMISTRPMRHPFVAETLAVGAGVVLGFAFVQQLVAFGGLIPVTSEPLTISITAAAFLVVMAMSFVLIEAVLKLPNVPMTRVNDTELWVSVAGVVLVLGSLFVLPWYSLEVTRIRVVTFKFLDWKALYDEFGDFVSPARLLYFEFGFLLSTLAAVALLIIVYRGRSRPLPSNPILRLMLIGTIVLMGLWQLVLVLGMQSIEDSDGSVRFGAWAGVIGHACMVFGCWRATGLQQTLGTQSRASASTLKGAMPPPPSGPPVA
jgi:hypothetical protein